MRKSIYGRRRHRIGRISKKMPRSRTVRYRWVRKNSYMKWQSPALEAVCSYPDHFAVMGKLPLNDPSGEAVMADWTKQPGMLGFRVSFRHAGTHSWLDDGTADWFWAGRALRSSGNGLCAIRSAENRRDRRTSSGTSTDRRSYGTKHTALQ
jgi:hypothetical protein